MAATEKRRATDLGFVAQTVVAHSRLSVLEHEASAGQLGRMHARRAG